MNPRNENLLKTLNLLTLLFNVKSENSTLAEEEQHTLHITKEHVVDTNLTIHTFINTLKLLSDKGYLRQLSIFEDKYRGDINNFYSDETNNDLIKQLSVNPEISNKLKESLIDDLKKAGIKVDIEEMKDQDISIEDLINDVKPHFQTLTDKNNVSLILLMPFRNINHLLKRMNDGKDFDDIQDSEFYYNSDKYEFHAGDDVISVSYQSKPNIEHDVLIRLRDEQSNGMIWYDDVDSYKPRALKDALIKFVNKNKKLSEIFTVHSDRLEINKDYLN